MTSVMRKSDCDDSYHHTTGEFKLYKVNDYEDLGVIMSDVLEL